VGDEISLNDRDDDEVLRAIIADDDPFARRTIKDALQRAGIVVIAEAHNGRQAVELCLHYRPHVVLMDVVMPELDGIAATRELSELLPSTPVIVLSAYEDPALLSEARQAGAAAYLVKGCQTSALVEEITKAAGRHG
jgi:DNA-binding NarL/FixJ family response regulator